MKKNSNADMFSVRCSNCALRKLACYRDVSPQELAFIQDLKSAHTSFPPRSTLVHENARAGLCTLYSGLAFRYKSLPDGQRQILNFLFPGDLIGLQDQLGQDSPHGVESLTDVELCSFDHRRLWTMFEAYPSLAYSVTWLAAHEEGIVDDNLLTVGRRSSKEKVASLMMYFHRRSRASGLARTQGGLEAVPFPLNQQHVADALGLSLVHVSRTMRALRAMGLYETRDGWLVFPKPLALERLAAYYGSPLTPRPLL
jgi:CRP/FNR family transcriptional regulator, anaerobic regulatory protein